MPDARLVDVSVRGLPLAAKARLSEVDAHSAFLEHEAPLPVGTKLMVREVGAVVEREARVLSVVEAEQGSKSPPGMKISWETVDDTGKKKKKGRKTGR